MAKEEVLNFEVPAPPALLPKKLQEKWTKDYIDAFKQAQNDFPGDTPAQKQAALREAHRPLRVPKLESYADAMKLEPWQFIKRAEQPSTEPGNTATVLYVLTIDGAAYEFPLPPPDARPGPGEQKPEKK